MQSIELMYLQILKQSCDSSKTAFSFTKEQQKELLTFAQRHFTSAFVLPYITDPVYLELLKKQTKSMMLQYHQIAHFTDYTISLLKQAHIQAVLLKGISIAKYYPEAEYRKVGDLDLYIADPAQLKQAKKILLSNGFVPVDEVSDHHLTYTYRFPNVKRSFTLELHFRVVGLYQYAPANAVIDRIFSSNTLSYVSENFEQSSYLVLPATEYAFYLLHHMLKHYLYSGFGIRLLCDFTFFLNAHKSEIDFKQLYTWCCDSHISHLYEIILVCCRLYLGLHDDIAPDIHSDKFDCDIFMQCILAEQDMGTITSSTLVRSGSYKKLNLLSYFKEFHLQMKIRFPKLKRCYILWPVLWGITLFYFIKNTYCLRRTSLRETFRTFKEHHTRTEQIRIFENSEQ